MLQNIFCIFGFLMFMTGLTFIYESEEKSSFFQTLIVSAWTAVMVGAVCAFVMDCLSILVNLKNITIAFWLCGGMVYLYLLKKKKVQKLSFQVSEFFSVIYCIIIWGYTLKKAFGIDLSIAYGNIDAGIHFKMACDILCTQRLTNSMYFASMYNSLIMEMLQPFLMEETVYKAFIIADALFNLLNLLMFWVVASQFARSRFSKIVLHVIVLFYFIGWPMWSWIVGGYVYFGQGVTIYMYGIYILNKFCQSYNKGIRRYCVALMLMALFCMIKCYLLFLPVFLASIIIYALYEMRGKITKKNVLYGLISILVIGTISFGLIYWGYFHGDFEYVFQALRREGFIFREVYKDFIFILPMNIYLCIIKSRKKKQDLLSIFILVHLLITLVAMVVCLCGWLSAYYYFKLYYIGWLLQMIGALQAIEHFWNERRQIIWFCILPVVILAIFELTDLNRMFQSRRLDSSKTFPVMADSINYINSLSDLTATHTSSLISACIWVNKQLPEEKVPIIVYNFMPLASWYGAITDNEWYSIEQGGLSDGLENLCGLESRYFAMIRDRDMFVEDKELLDCCPVVYNDGFFTVYLNIYE